MYVFKVKESNGELLSYPSLTIFKIFVVSVAKTPAPI